MPSQVEQKSNFNGYCWLFKSVLLFVLAPCGNRSKCAIVAFNYYLSIPFEPCEVGIPLGKGFAEWIYEQQLSSAFAMSIIIMCEKKSKLFCT